MTKPLNRRQRRTATRVIDKDGLTVIDAEPTFDFDLRDLAFGLVVVVLAFGLAGYLSNL